MGSNPAASTFAPWKRAFLPRLSLTLQTLASDSEVPADLLFLHRCYLEEHDEEPPGGESGVAFHLTALLEGEYTAVLFSNKKGQAVGYALFEIRPRYVYLRVFHIQAELRGRGYGPEAIKRLRREFWRNVASIQVDADEANDAELSFWKSIGFRARTVRLELETAKKSSTRKSCGAIIYRRTLLGTRYLLVEHVDGGHWGFPKGHGTGYETEEETATREIFEETGLRVQFRPGFYERSHYLTAKSRKKEVVCFLARARRPRVRTEPEEIRSFRWLDYREARQLMTFENTRVLLDKAHAFVSGRKPQPF